MAIYFCSKLKNMSFRTIEIISADEMSMFIPVIDGYLKSNAFFYEAVLLSFLKLVDHHEHGH